MRVDATEFSVVRPKVSATDLATERALEIDAGFVLDCSGYGRVLPRLLGLERPALLSPRVACYTQFEGDLRPEGDREGDIWICVHPDDGWIWIIPFSNGRTSIGMVCGPECWSRFDGAPIDKLLAYLRLDENCATRIARASVVAPTRVIRDYSKKVDRFHGDGWAVAGNAADFLDPVFSSGVTLALESASLAAELVDRQLTGASIDWNAEYDAVVDRAVGVFFAFVSSWYRRELEAIMFAKEKPERVKRRIASILAGNVLRTDNPLASEPERTLRLLYQTIRNE